MTNKYYSKEKIAFLVDGFKNSKLPITEWTHDAHLIVAIYFMYKFEFLDSVCKIKSGIILLNNSNFIQNTGNNGYHETLTIFWSKIISTFIEINKELDLENIVNLFVNSPLASRFLPLDFYEKEKILSSYFRAIYVEEDKNKITVNTIRKYLS